MTQTTKKQSVLIFTGIAVTLGIITFAHLGFFTAGKTPPSAEPLSENTPAATEPIAAKTLTNDSTLHDSSSTNSSSTQFQREAREGTSVAPGDQPVVTDPDTSTFQVAGTTFPLRTYKPHAVNDPSGNQWWTSSTGLNAAWSVSPGSTQTTVAVIDTGFALQHEEFAGRWASNSSEQGSTSNESPSKLNCTDRGLLLDKSCNLIDDDFDGIVDNEVGATTRQNPSQLNCTDRGLLLDKSCNLIDDDSNGYIDDVTGWDFANSDASVQAGQTNTSGDGVRHGTAVAGVLAASGNNNKGIAGVDWRAKILPLQALDDDAYGNTLTVSRAIYYAADQGVDVINLSLGSDAEDPYLRQAVHYALSKNVIVVAASGNEGCDCLSYPARYPEVVAVGAHTQSGVRSTFSNYGTELDLLAPGENITAPSWSETTPQTGYANNLAGTSFAAPFVSGLLSLARSHQPTAQWGELTNGLLATANHGTLTSANPFSTHIGSGYARADTFMTRLTTPDRPGIRYTFRPTPIKSTLSSSLAYQCISATDFPTARLYEITSGATVFYTIDELERVRAISRGDTVTYITRTCVGLPTDQPTTIRLINLLREIKNMQSNKDW